MPSPAFRGENDLMRARRAARAYRQKLCEVDEAACLVLDAAMRRDGEHWLLPRELTYTLEDWLTPEEAAEAADVKVRTLETWRRRGRLTGHLGADGIWRYLARDVIALAVEKHTRGKA